MTVSSRQQFVNTIRSEINIWAKDQKTSNAYSVPSHWNAFPNDLLQALELNQPQGLVFTEWDVDYLYQQRLMSRLSSWICEQPLRDTLLEQPLNIENENLAKEELVRLTEACKLFDWTVRNIVLSQEGSADYETLTTNPSPPLDDTAIGYGTLPWETALFTEADFIERGRVFNALARQRKIPTAWVGIGKDAADCKLFMIAVVLGDRCYLFDPKSGLPLLNPDELKFATLKEARENSRIIQRLSLTGQYRYPLSSKAELNSLIFLMDLEPQALTARMQLLDDSLVADDRMVLFTDSDALAKKLSAGQSEIPVKMWMVPIYSLVYATSIRQQLRSTSASQQAYMGKYAIWLFDTPISRGRLQHLNGQFRQTDYEEGALTTYMNSRVTNEKLEQLMYDPNVQQELEIEKNANESDEQFQFRLKASQMLFARAKIDAAFLLGQLQFDMGNYASAKSWLENRVLPDERSSLWHNGAAYTLARAYQEMGDLKNAEQAIKQLKGPQDAGNRLRLRFLKAMANDNGNKQDTES